MESIIYQEDLVQFHFKIRGAIMSDQLFKKSRKSREICKRKIQKDRSETWLFVCEGTKTEPNYITSLINYANNFTSQSPLKFKAEGVGKNTETLISSVYEFFECTEKFINQKTGIPYAKTFVLFDKDSFKDCQFDNAIKMAEAQGYIPIWSNECFELWYILHYCYYDIDNGRESYFAKLKELIGEKYDKADDIFSLIHTPDSLKKAMKYSKKLDEESRDKKSASKMVPCTQMFRVVEEIQDRLKIDLTKV